MIHNRSDAKIMLYYMVALINLPFISSNSFYENFAFSSFCAPKQTTNQQKIARKIAYTKMI